MKLRSIAILFFLLLLPAISFAQEHPASIAHDRTDSGDRINDGNFLQERTAIEDLLISIIGLVKEVATDVNPSGITTRLNEMTKRLSSISHVKPEFEFASPSGSQAIKTKQLRADELEQLEQLLRDVLEQVVQVRHDLHIEGKPALARRTESMESRLLDGIALIHSLKGSQSQSVMSDSIQDTPIDRSIRTSNRSRNRERSTSDGYLRPGTYNDSNNREDQSYEEGDNNRESDGSKQQEESEWRDGDYSWTNDDDVSRGDQDREEWNSENGRRGRKSNRRRRSDRLSGSSSAFATYVGEFRSGWPFKEFGVYRTAPAIRYNRVDGLVLGIRKLPLAWDSWDYATVYGHGGYAIASRRWQYEIGAETRAFRREARSIDVKVGASYRRATTTDDLWKSSWLENSVGAILFNYDFFDYFETVGFTGYASLRMTPYVQVTGAYRSEEHSSLQSETTWSLFGGNNFTFNRQVQNGRMNTVLMVLEGGSVKDYEWMPRGAAFRIEGEIGEGLGGDFSFNRVVADGRVYIPMGNAHTLALRVRGGTSTGNLPTQKIFRIGGVGSVRSYSQNSLFGTRMLIGNIEYFFSPDPLWDELTLSLFMDAGWVNSGGSDEFRFDDVFQTMGIGASIIEQSIRLELAWPIDTDRVNTREPSLWLRLARSF